MSAAPQEMLDQDAQMLARVAELALELAEDVQKSALAAQDPGDKARLAAAFHQVSRSLRQSLALKARLRRDAALAEREAAKAAAAQARARKSARGDHLRTALKRLVWDEKEGSEAEALDALVDDLVDEESDLMGFAERDLPAQLQDLAGQLGLKAQVRAVEPPGSSPAGGGGPPKAVEGVAAPGPAPTDPLRPSGIAPPEGEHRERADSS